MTQTINAAAQELGRRGAKKVFEKYGPDHYSKMGKLSGEARRKKRSKKAKA